MLEGRLDERINAPEPGTRPGLALQWKQNQRRMDADLFDQVADQIEHGLVTIRGKDPELVQRHLRERANKIRAGTDRPRRRIGVRVSEMRLE